MIGSMFLLFAVVIGAFGAHGLKSMLAGKYLSTFQTGVTYHYYHGFALLMLGALSFHSPKLYHFNKSFFAFTMGILLFSGCCYLYSLTKIKTFAMIVPLGGVSFILGWFFLALSLRNWRKVVPPNC